MHAEKTDVLIVGAGPTGLMMALLLVRQGVRPLIIDKNAGPAQQTRAMGVQARTLEMYAQLGLANQAVEAGAIAKGIHLWSGGRHRVRVPLESIGLALSAFPFVLMLGQDENERLLGEALAGYGVHIRWNTVLRSLDQQPDHVIVSLQDAHGARDTVRATWVAGCDGSHSKVREACDVRFVGAPYEQVFFVADTVARGGMRPGEVNAYLLRRGFHLFFPMRGENRWRVIGILPAALRDRVDLDFAQLAPTLCKEAGDMLAFDECLWFSTYRIHHRCAERFRIDRCFLLGDAAHVHSPMGAQGMNTGLQDAYNLAWKLGMVIRAEGEPSLLDSFEEERRPIAQALLRGTDRAFGLMVSAGPWAEFFRLHLMANVARIAMRLRIVRETAFRLISQIGIHYRSSRLSRATDDLSRKAARPGDRFPWLRVALAPNQAGVDVHSLFDLRRFTLLLIGDAGSTPAPRPWMHVVRVPELDENAQALRLAGLRSPSFHLVRPDGYIALSGSQLLEQDLSGYLAAIGMRCAA